MSNKEDKKLIVYEKFRENITITLKSKLLKKEKLENYLKEESIDDDKKSDITEKQLNELSKIENEINILMSILQTSNNDNLYDVYIKISRYANRKYIKELANNISAEYYYGAAIYKLMQKGINLDWAIKIFEMKVKLKMISLNLSEFVAVLNLLFFKNEIEALMFEKEYLNQKTNQHKYYYIIRENLLSSGEYKTKKVNGMTLISKTEKGIENLEYLINYVYRNKKSKYLNLLSQTAESAGLIIGDFSFDKKISESYYSAIYRYIYIKNDTSIDEMERTFYHETTHFLDNIRITDRNESKYFSANDQALKKLVEKIKKELKFFL